MISLSKFSKTILGMFIGVFLFFGSVSLLAYLVFYKMSVIPDKPVFIEENSYNQINNESITNYENDIT
ncbi:hypothetical protein [Candidatus Atelocyanobacterium thalassae]|jgi:hypothetical protein|uniref:Uncharacterized protein n=1 Tax=Atelocyanobacterium thalassa (isolate ALOHA) TaxID=1453429 RepID=D3EQX7_ATETH|nr:hypothetical protein [Candidatus Atelocyanobacterium thalassa]ADB95877.1 hypothetical protein UCYN_12090 [Candidatus Atelocyanobacterium thalassa isolate ALOHA]MCH2543645.1 hypothetical protein [Candidatus Atelocyanobacterium sp. ALOHA_A2.5_9]|tara:strand:+ start:334 stop:537 length:204 start_codon:yes stop_codon:yes gene_type:complete